MDAITITKTELAAAVIALGRPNSPVYSAHKKGAYIVILFCGDTEPIEYKLPSRRRKANTLPVEVHSD